MSRPVPRRSSARGTGANPRLRYAATTARVRRPGRSVRNTGWQSARRRARWHSDLKWRCDPGAPARPRPAAQQLEIAFKRMQRLRYAQIRASTRTPCAWRRAAVNSDSLAPEPARPGVPRYPATPAGKRPAVRRRGPRPTRRWYRCVPGPAPAKDGAWQFPDRRGKLAILPRRPRRLLQLAYDPCHFRQPPLAGSAARPARCVRH